MRTTRIKPLEDRLETGYHSHEEALIGHQLDRYRIPFFYRQATIVYDQGKNQLVYPAFTLPSYGGAVIDYHREAYGHSYQDQKDRYQSNQIPVILITDAYLQRPDWPSRLYSDIAQIRDASRPHYQ